MYFLTKMYQKRMKNIYSIKYNFTLKSRYQVVLKEINFIQSNYRYVDPIVDGKVVAFIVVIYKE